MFVFVFVGTNLHKKIEYTSITTKKNKKLLFQLCKVSGTEKIVSDETKCCIG